MAESSVRVRGVKELHRALRKIHPRQAQNALRAGIRAGGAIIQKDARVRAKARWPNAKALHKGLVVKVRRQRNPYHMDVRVGPTTGRGARHNAWYAHLLEFGVAPHDISVSKYNKVMVEAVGGRGGGVAYSGRVFGVKVRHPGIGGRPFLGPAYMSKRAMVPGAISDKLWKHINKAMRETKKI